MEHVNASWLEWGTASAALADEGPSGDRHVVVVSPGGAILAVVDGLGHGPEAALAAETAAATIEEHAPEDLVELLQRCHEALRTTRGVVMGIARLRPESAELEWLGVGDVDGVVARGQEVQLTWLVQRSGVVGAQLPAGVSTSRVSLQPGDTLALATDGVRTDFTQLVPDVPPQQLAERILAECGRRDDDALILVARYRGEAT